MARPRGRVRLLPVAARVLVVEAVTTVATVVAAGVRDTAAEGSDVPAAFVAVTVTE